MNEKEARQRLVDAGRRLVAEGLVARSWGNLSVRLDAATIAVTPSGILWDDFREEMVSLVNLETGEWSGSWKPSGERKVHREIYRRRPEVGAVVHTHQNAASACSAARKPVPTPMGLVPCARYALPGTKALTRATVDALGQGHAVLMANHGVFTVGTGLDEAFDAVASLERDCADYLASRNGAALPARADERWNPSWIEPVVGGVGAWLSTAPYTLAWAALGRPLPAVLDDLAQFVGPRVAFSPKVPTLSSPGGAVLVPGGAVVWGPDAEALAMVVEKAARAMFCCHGLGGPHPFPAWEARLMRWVYRNSYSKLAKK